MQTVKSSDLSTWKMVAGNEDIYSKIIRDGMIWEWTAIGWIEIGPASEEDKKLYPTVKDD